MKNLLKVLTITLAVTCIAGLASCSKDEDDKQKDKIVGTWEETYYDFWEIDPETNEKFEESGTTSGEFTVFDKNGSGYLYFNGIPDKYLFTWKVSDGKIYITAGGRTESYSIIKLNSFTLETEEHGVDEDGFEYYWRSIYTKR